MHYILDELFSKKELFILGLEDWEYRKINSEEIKTISGKEDRNGRLTLNHFPPGILELANLESIEFIGHKIPGIPSAVGCLKELKILNLEANEISGLVSRFFEEFRYHKSFRELILPRNKIAWLPPEIGCLKSLEVLDVEQNLLASLPSEIGSLNCLKDLNVRKNKITSLPSEIGSLNCLEYLCLDDNQITHLPPEISKLSNLEGLYLSNCPLVSLPIEILELSKLRELDLRGTQVKESTINRIREALPGCEINHDYE